VMDGNRGSKRKLDSSISKDPDYDFDHENKKVRHTDEEIKNSDFEGKKFLDYLHRMDDFH